MDQAADDPVEQGSLLFQDQLCIALYAASRAVTARYRSLVASWDSPVPSTW